MVDSKTREYSNIKKVMRNYFSIYKVPILFVVVALLILLVRLIRNLRRFTEEKVFLIVFLAIVFIIIGIFLLNNYILLNNKIRKYNYIIQNGQLCLGKIIQGDIIKSTAINRCPVCYIKCDVNVGGETVILERAFSVMPDSRIVNDTIGVYFINEDTYIFLTKMVGINDMLLSPIN